MPDTTDELGDDDSTLPPPPDTDSGAPTAPRLPSAYGDFRDRETTVAAVTEDRLVRIRLTSAGGAVAHFALDVATASIVAHDLASRIAEPYFQSSFPRPAERALPTGELERFDTDVFFAKDDEPRVRVTKDPADDRIAMRLWSREASLHISMQVGVAFTLERLFSAAAAAVGP